MGSSWARAAMLAAVRLRLHLGPTLRDALVAIDATRDDALPALALVVQAARVAGAAALRHGAAPRAALRCARRRRAHRARDVGFRMRRRDLPLDAVRGRE